MKKKRIALLMAAAMVMTSLPTNAWAGADAFSGGEITEEFSTGDAFTDESTGTVPEIQEEIPVSEEAVMEELPEEENVPGADTAEGETESVPEEIPGEEDTEEFGGETEDVFSEDAKEEEVTEIFTASGEAETLNTEEWEEATELTVGGSYEVSCAEEEVRYFTFTPEETGIYCLYSEGSYDTYAALYAAETSEFVTQDDDGGTNSNFSISWTLQADTKYVYEVSGYNKEAMEAVVFFEKAPDITGITAIEMPSKLTVGLEDDYASILEFEITYSNGSTELIKIGRSDKYGNELQGELLDSETEASVDEIKAGTYILRLQIGDETRDFGVTYVDELEDMEILKVGGRYRVSFGEGGSRSYFKFTPSETGKYIINTTDEDGVVQKDLYILDETTNRLSLQESVNEEMFNSILYAGKTYVYKMSCNRSFAFRFLFEKVPYPTGLKILEENRTLVPRVEEDSFRNMQAEITYSDGNKEVLYLDQDGKYGDRIFKTLYKEMEDGTLEEVEDIWDITESGTYVMEASVYGMNGYITSSAKIQCLSIQDAAKDHVLSLGGSILLSSANANYQYVQFTAKEAGIYKFESEASLRSIRVYDAQGNGMDFLRLESYRLQIALKEGQTCCLVLEPRDKITEFYVSAELLPSVAHVTVCSYEKTTFVAGLESVGEGSFYSEIVYSDGTKTTIDRWDSDIYGNEFSFQIENENGEKTDFGKLSAGIYRVWAVDSNGEKAPESSLEIRVTDMDTDDLPELKEGVEATLTPGNDRLCYRFVPQKTADYYLCAGVYMSCGWCKKTENGLEDITEWGNSDTASLQAGETYVLSFDSHYRNTMERFKIDLLENKQILKVDEPVEITSNGGLNVLEIEESDNYTITVERTSGESGSFGLRTLSYSEVGINSVYTENEENSQVITYTGYLAGRVSIYAETGTYQVSLKKTGETGEKIQPVSFTIKKTEKADLPLYFLPAVDAMDLIKLEVTYSDGSQGTVSPYAADEHMVKKSWQNEDLSIVYSLKLNGMEQTFEIILDGNTEGIETLKEDTPIVLQGEVFRSFTFTPEETGTYYLSKGTAVTFDVESGDPDFEEEYGGETMSGRMTLTGGKTYGILVKDYYDEGETLVIRKAKDVKSLKLLKKPDVVYRDENVYAQIIVEITYTDGTKLTVADGEEEPYGNAGGRWSSTISADRKRYYVCYGNSRVFFDVKLKDRPESDLPVLPVLGENVATEVKIEESRQEMLINPKESGIYSVIVLRTDEGGALFGNTYSYVAGVGYGGGYLEAGESYVLRLFNYGENPTGSMSVYLMKKDQGFCSAGHEYEVKMTRPATPNADGMEYRICRHCGYIKTATLKYEQHIHTGEWETVTEPTCTKVGEAVLKCSVCGELLEKKELPKIAHTPGSMTTVKNATVFAAGSKEQRCTVCKTLLKTETIKQLTPTIQLSVTSVSLRVGQTSTAVKVSGLAAGDKVSSWKSSNTKAVTVDSTGKLTAKAAGSATITVTLASKKTASVKVTVVPKTTKITGLSSGITLNKGKTTTLKPVHYPTNANEPFTYSTSNSKVVTVSSSGQLKAIARGTANITVKAGSASFVVKVTVPTTRTKAITNVAKTLSLAKGKTYTLKPTLSPSNTDEKTITYSSSNKSVATVSSAGVIKALKAGSANITLKCGSVSFVIKVTVPITRTKAITNVAKTLSLAKGKTYTLKPTLSPSNTDEKTITYSSSNKSVATVSSTGVIKALKAGTAKITIKCGSASFVVTVTVPVTRTTSITGVRSTLSLQRNKTYTLKPRLNPSNSDEKITYSSSNKSVATVSSTGVIKGLKKGTAVITVKSGSKSVTCKVTVK